MKKLLKLCMVVIFISGLSTFAFADDKDVLIQKLIKRVDDLEKKVEALTNKLSIYERAPTTTVSDEVIQRKVDDILAKREEKMGGLLKALKDINVSGFVDASYVVNFRGSDDTLTNTARVFDKDANNFSLQAAELVLERLPADTGGVGFRTDLFFGEDAEVITPSGSTPDEFDLQEAYIILKPPLRFNLPFGNWQWIKIGKFVTMHGAEVIESKDNWNFSRSLLFGYAIPFTHTGIRLGYQLHPKVSAYLGVNNGWDNVKDNNKAKSLEGALAWVPNDKLSFNLAGMIGPERAGDNHSQRGLIDFLATYRPFPKWTFMLNADYAHEENAVEPGVDGSWSGVAFYARYDMYDWFSIINRIEYFNDRKGLRVVSGVEEELWENTLTFEFRPYKDLITRLEYRHDESTADIFMTEDDTISHQDTFSVEMIYMF